MSQHFYAIGFRVDTPEDLKKLAQQAIKQGSVIAPKRKGLPDAVFLWDLGRGLQIWVGARRISDATEDDYEIIYCQPGCYPKESVPIRLYRIAQHKERSGEALIRVRIDEKTDATANLLDLARYDTLPLSGTERRMHIAGLALEAETWDPKADSARIVQFEDEEGNVTVINSLFVPLDRDCHYQILGDILETGEVVNFHTGEKQLLLKVATSELMIPIIVPSNYLEDSIETGNRFQGIIWLQAQFGEGN